MLLDMIFPKNVPYHFSPKPPAARDMSVNFAKAVRKVCER